jgi:hypothetical protein
MLTYTPETLASPTSLYSEYHDQDVTDPPSWNPKLHTWMASRNSRRLIMQWGLWNPSYLLIRCNTAAYDTSWKNSYHEADTETCKHTIWKNW